MKNNICSLLIIMVALSFISCAAYKKDHAVTCKDAQINGAFFKVRCVGELSASPEKIKATFEEHAISVCKDHGYSGFKISDSIPQTSAGYNATIECTK